MDQDATPQAVPIQDNTRKSYSYKKVLIPVLIIAIILGLTTTWFYFPQVYGKLGILKLLPFYSTQEKQLDSILFSVNALEQLNPRTDKEAFETKKESINIYVQSAKTALEKGDTETARQQLLKAKNAFLTTGDPLKSVFVPQEEKQKHDPKDKYIQKDRVDPRIREQYLQIIDILVSLDKNYYK